MNPAGPEIETGLPTAQPYRHGDCITRSVVYYTHVHRLLYDHNKMNYMDGACSRYREEERCIRDLVEKPELQRALEDKGVDGG